MTPRLAYGFALAAMLFALIACGRSGADTDPGGATSPEAQTEVPPIEFSGAPRRGFLPQDGAGDPRAGVTLPTPGAASAPAVTDVAGSIVDADDRPSVPFSDAVVEPALSARVEAAVARALSRARKASSDRVHGRNVVVSMVAVDAETGRVLVRRQSEVALVPASNMKLLTVAAALVTLGADGSFTTVFETDAPMEGGVLEGDLVVRAGGDPLHRREGDGSLGPWLEPLAAALRAAGIQRVSGALILDEGAWLEPGPGPQWPSKAEYWNDHCALAGGFSANAGCFRATITPTREGQRATVILRPRHHGLTRKGSVTTTGSRLTVNVGANRGGVTVRGSIRADAAPYVTSFSHPDPVDLFGHVMIGGLADRGIIVDGGFVRARGVELKDPRVIHTMRSAIASVIPAILLDSNNSVADQLFFAAGAQAAGEGTREAGARAVRLALESLGVEARSLVQVDGSGLSKANRTSAEQVAALVAAVIHKGGAVREAIVDSLPVSGRSGSLKRRMRGTVAEGQVRAKTGWVKGASALSGVVSTLEGREVVFSILVGYPLVDGINTKAWKPMQDEICIALTEWTPEGWR